MSSKRRSRGRGTYESGRPPVLTLKERFTGKVKFIVMTRLSISAVNSVVRANVDGRIEVYTDEYGIYNGLSKLDFVIRHERVNHSDGEFAKDDVSINGCEAVHSWLRVFLRIHRGVNRYNLQLYVSFFAFYHNYGNCWLIMLIKSCLNWRKEEARRHREEIKPK